MSDEVIHLVETVAAAAEGEAKKLETDVETVAAGAVAQAEEKASVFSAEVRIAVTDAEALALAKMENQYLKAQTEMTRLSQIINNIGQNFPKEVDKLGKKYLVNPATHIWDSVQGAFVKNM